MIGVTVFGLLNRGSRFDVSGECLKKRKRAFFDSASDELLELATPKTSETSEG